MASTGGKLTAAQKQQVIQWLCEGLGNAEICKALAEDGVEVTHQAIDYYRGAYAEKIDEAREEALRKVVQQGFAAHTAAKADGATDAEARQAAEEAWDAVMEGSECQASEPRE